MYLSSELYRAFVLTIPQNPLLPLEGQDGKLMRSKIPPHAVKLGGYVAGTFLRKPAQIVPPLARKFREETREAAEALDAKPFDARHAAEEIADVMTAVAMFRNKVSCLPLLESRAPPQQVVQDWEEVCEGYSSAPYHPMHASLAALVAITEESFTPPPQGGAVSPDDVQEAMTSKIAKVGDYDGWLVTCIVLPRTTEKKWLDMFTHWHEVDASLLKEEEMLTPDQVHVVTNELAANRPSEEAFKTALRQSGMEWVEGLRKHYGHPQATTSD